MAVIHAQLTVLREELRRRFPVAHPDPRVPAAPRLVTGLEGLDDLHGGGLPRGRLTSWLGRHGGGLTSLARAVAAATLRTGHRVAMVDAGRCLDPVDWCHMEGEERLWIIRPERAHQALTATELLAGCGGFALVMLDMVQTPVGGLCRASHHLKRASEAGTSALLLLGDGAASARPHMSLRLTPLGLGGEGRWRVEARRVDGAGASLAPQEVRFDARHRLSTSRLPRVAPLPDRRRRATRPRREGFELGVDPGAR